MAKAFDSIKRGMVEAIEHATERSRVFVGTDLLSAKQAADLLETDVETIRRMVVETMKLKALVVCRVGSRSPLRLAGLFAHTVNDDCTVTDARGRDAGSLRFVSTDLLRVLESVVLASPASPVQETTIADQQTPSVVTAACWKELAKVMANEVIKSRKANDLYPNQIDIANDIARQFRKDGVVGSNGKPLTGSYIKRHALKGISSAVVKRASTKILRGK